MAKGYQTIQHVSPSPSKIPYVGFSHSTASNRHSTATFINVPRFKHKACMHQRDADLYAAKVKIPVDRGPLGLPFVGSCEPIGSVSGNLDEPVQRPLARQRVMLSRRVNAYYDLIRNSRPLPATYGFVDGSLPYGLVWAGTERLPNLLCVTVSPCRHPYPGGPDGCRWLFLHRL